MWYVVQTPVGREAEAAEKLNHFYRDKAEKPCFVLSKERTWRMGGVYYVDTEVMNPLIADQYISTVSKFYFNPWTEELVLRCPTIDIVNVRTAFLTQTQGRAMLTYTLDMEHVLKNNARYLQPLRQTGMKVCLVIKGGGTGLGFANLSDGQINDFVA